MIKNPILKIVLTLFFIFSVITTNKFEVEKLILFFLVLLILIFTYKINFKKFFKKFTTLIPFILFFSITLLFNKNDLYFKLKIFNLIELNLSYQVLNYISVVLKSILSLFSLLLLIETTSFIDLVKGLEILKIPKELTTTILLIYRYFFVLLDEIKRMEIARDMRYFGGYIKREIKIYSNIIATLFLRSIERSERVFNAMRMRGYDGNINYLISFEFNKKEIIFLTIFIFIILILKFI